MAGSSVRLQNKVDSWEVSDLADGVNRSGEQK